MHGLVPGPHFLGSALDHQRPHPSRRRRLIYALLVVVAISTGLLLGLALLGASCHRQSAGRSLWQDVIAAGVAVCAYSVFFSTPLAMLLGRWRSDAGPLRWGALSLLGMGVATGARLSRISPSG
jgi:hypothetical protein